MLDTDPDTRSPDLDIIKAHFHFFFKNIHGIKGSAVWEYTMISRYILTSIESLTEPSWHFRQLTRDTLGLDGVGQKTEYKTFDTLII